MNKPITKGTIVRYQDGWMEVTTKFKNHVNLGHIFYGKTKIKKVPLSEIKEDYDGWWEVWSQSETYKCM